MISDQAILFLIAAAMGAQSIPAGMRLVMQASVFCLGIFVWIIQ
jgi:hypothetical protein